jgi:hypothetical protein
MRFEYDEEPDPETWGGWLEAKIKNPSPKLKIERKRKELTRRILVLNTQIRVYEMHRSKAERQLRMVIKKGNATQRMQDLLGTQIAKYESIQEQCAYSIVKYQQGLISLEKLDQMRQTTTDFAHITLLLVEMNRRLNMKRTVSMARAYDRHMDTMEVKEDTMAEMLLERDEMDTESIEKAHKYVQKAREKAGLETEEKLPAAQKGKIADTDAQDDALIRRVMNL